jgi:SPP1 gp7 family putative phage head morphogenesis protein
MHALVLSPDRLVALRALSLAHDRASETREERRRFAYSRHAEETYARQLRGIADQVGRLVRGIFDGTADTISLIAESLRRYSETIAPWADAVAARVVADASRRDERVWKRHAGEVYRRLYAEVRRAPVGDVARQLIGEQAALIKSLPLEAAERVQALALEGIVGGRRWTEVRDEILNTHHVTRSRANLIARTESSRASTMLTQARAEHVGSTHYFWRSVRDADTRPSHRRMEGKAVAWDDPPMLDGLIGHAGMLPNCRPSCWPEPVIPHYP